MWIITRYILREHIGPFVFGLATIVFIFILNVLFRDLDRLLGKGLPVGIVIELFFLHLAWIVALAVPMAVLIATLMAFGRLSADSEIAALKASGINLYRLIGPVFIISILLCLAMERFNNCVLPEFNHRLRMLYSDISRKRPTLSLEPHVFFDEIPDYSMLVKKIDNRKNQLTGIIIHDKRDPDINRTIIAESGYLTFSEVEECIVLTLHNSEIHEVNLKDLTQYKHSQFERQVLKIQVPNMVLKRSETRARGDREKSARMMLDEVEQNRVTIQKRYRRISEMVKNDLKSVFPAIIFFKEESDMNPNQTDRRWNQGRIGPFSRIQNMIQKLEGENRVIEGYRYAINKRLVEVHKKYSIPVACIVFVLIGAPLGIMARHGGLAMAGGISLVFFLIYWSFLIGGEQLADRGAIPPAVAMWAPNIIVGGIGVYMVVHSVKEMSFIPWKQWGVWFKDKWNFRKR